MSRNVGNVMLIVGTVLFGLGVVSGGVGVISFSQLGLPVDLAEAQPYLTDPGQDFNQTYITYDGMHAGWDLLLEEAWMDQDEDGFHDACRNLTITVLDSNGTDVTRSTIGNDSLCHRKHQSMAFEDNFADGAFVIIGNMCGDGEEGPTCDEGMEYRIQSNQSIVIFDQDGYWNENGEPLVLGIVGVVIAFLCGGCGGIIGIIGLILRITGSPEPLPGQVVFQQPGVQMGMAQPGSGLAVPTSPMTTPQQVSPPTYQPGFLVEDPPGSG